MMTSFIDLTGPANLLSFDFEFLADGDAIAEGLLSVYLDGGLIAQMDERFFSTGEFSTGEMWLGRD